MEHAPPPSPRTNRTRRVPHPVLIGHAASLTLRLQQRAREGGRRGGGRASISGFCTPARDLDIPPRLGPAPRGRAHGAGTGEGGREGERERVGG